MTQNKRKTKKQKKQENHKQTNMNEYEYKMETRIHFLNLSNNLSWASTFRKAAKVSCNILIFGNY